MNLKKIDSKYLFYTGAILAVVLIFTKKKIKKNMLPINQKNFIKYIYPLAVTIEKKIGVPAIFLTSQIILETGSGKSILFTKYFNVGGIKARGSQAFVNLPTIEYIKGVKTKVNANFAVYPDLISGLLAYSKIFQNRYFKKYLNVTTDPDKYVELLQSGPVKYATDINYINKIKKLNNTVKSSI